jgi:hypothetical protein
MNTKTVIGIFAGLCAFFAMSSSYAANTVSCSVTAKNFVTTARQTDGDQQDCVDGICQSAGYGFVGYRTEVHPSSDFAPWVSIASFGQDEDQLGQPVNNLFITFEMPNSFFKRKPGNDLFNREANRLYPQRINTRLETLRKGSVDKQIIVPILGDDNISVSYEAADVRCLLLK